MCLPKVNFEITLLSLTLYKTVTHHLTIPKNTPNRDFISLQQNFYSRKLYFQNFRIMSDTVWHVSRISWISPPGISMFDANDSGPKKHDYLSPQLLNRKSDYVTPISCSIAFLYISHSFPEAFYAKILGQDHVERLKPISFDARAKINPNFKTQELCNQIVSCPRIVSVSFVFPFILEQRRVFLLVAQI